MTFPYKIKVDKCVGSCNDVNNPYFKVSTPDILKNISVKFLDLISKKNVLKNIIFHKSCKCDCLLDGIKINVDVNVYKLKSVMIILLGMLLIVDANLKKQLN